MYQHLKTCQARNSWVSGAPGPDVWPRDEVNKVSWTMCMKIMNQEFLSVLDKHEPIKTRKLKNKPLPCMNSELRSAMHKKHMLYSHLTKNKNVKTWDKYRRQRNLATKLKKKSMKNYFLERCTGGCKNSNFWSTMKPFFL